MNTRENVRLTFDPKLEDKIQEIVETNFELYKRITDDPDFGRALKNFLFDDYIRRHRRAEELLKLQESKTLEFKSSLRLGDLAGEVYRWCQALAPYGEGNPAPVFISKGVSPADVRHMGSDGQHIRLKLREGKATFDAVAFRQGGQWVEGTPFLDVVYTLGSDRRGDTEVISLRILDFHPSNAS